MVLRRLPKVEPQMQIRPLTSTKSGLRWGGLDYKLASNAGLGRFMPCWPDLQGYFQEFLTTTITTSTLTRTSRTFTPGASCVCVRSDPTLQISCSHAPKLPGYPLPSDHPPAPLCALRSLTTRTSTSASRTLTQARPRAQSLLYEQEQRSKTASR